MQVTKALVIGLGSTGTEICANIIRRIEWELDSISRAPWIRFLCIETDGNNRQDGVRPEDFMAMTISAEDYAHILNNPEVWDEKIELTKWADMNTLKKLPHNTVHAGAGNIRMVGRLAFLFPQNYEQIAVAVRNRLNDLRLLTVGEAQERYGKTPDGQPADIEFANNGQVAVYVVGTLCGGTCSGIVSDFGFFLNLEVTPGEKVIGMFTIPHANLTSTTLKSAERFKRNAYSALVELNQYHLPGSVDGKAIRFPDGRRSSVTAQPYELLFVASPRQVGTDYNTQLNVAIADYIFLNVFVPTTLPLAEAVNAPVAIDRANQAHVFCTFGLSTLEFPAQQVMEACAYRLGYKAIKPWIHKSIVDEKVKDWVNTVGLTWQNIRDLLFDESLRRSIDALVEKIQKALQELRLGEARHLIDQLVAMFKSSNPEGLYDKVMSNRQEACNWIIERASSQITTILGDYRFGPGVALQFLDAVDERLNELKQHPPVDFRDFLKRLEEIIVERPPSSGGMWDRILYKIFRKQRPLPGVSLARELLLTLAFSLMDQLVHDALKGKVDEFGVPEPGIIDRVRKEISLYRKRTFNLRDRLIHLVNDFSRQDTERSSHTPNVNGEVLFTPGSTSGTVADEFRRCLELDAAGTIISVDEHVVTLGKQIVGQVLSQLARYVTLPGTTTRESDLLMQPLDVSHPETWLPENILQQLMDELRRPFRVLRQENVLQKWASISGNQTPEAVASSAAAKAVSFLDLNETQATFGGFSPVLRSRLLLIPPSGATDKFRSLVQNYFSDHRLASSPDTWRVVFVQNHFRFPLRGVPSIVGESGISRAKCDDFPTFFTRKDIAWLGVTEEEGRRVRRAEELVTVALLLEIIRPEHGYLVFNMGTGIGDPGIKRLPLSLVKASMMLAQSDQDLAGYKIPKAMDVLEARINDFRQSKFQNDGGDVAFIRYVDQQLKDKVGSTVPDWDVRWLAERFERYCAKDTNLFNAYNHVFPPDPAVIAKMRRRKDDPLPGRGAPCERDGLYCDQCGGWVGEDEQDAAANGWRCFVNPDHYFGNLQVNQS